VFFGLKVAGHDAIGHDGATMTFFSRLMLFPGQDVGIFVSRDGIGEIGQARDMREIPDPVTLIARHLLPAAPGEPADGRTVGVIPDADMAGVYHPSRRAESTFVRLNELVSQVVVAIDGTGDARLSAAIRPFAAGERFRRVDRQLYEGPAGARIAFIESEGSEPYIAAPAIRLQRVPWSLDVRWIGTALAASAVVAVLTLLAWPFAAMWRRWRRKRWGGGSGDRRKFLAARLVLLVDVVVIAATAFLFFMSLADMTVLGNALDPLVLVVYAFAWLGVVGAVPVVWAAATFWRDGVGTRWSRVHHTLIAASSVMMAWFFLTFRIAGTTLNY
jgi:hypothetical protein